MSSKYILKKSLRFSAASVCIISAFLANHAKAQNLYFQPNTGANYGVTAGSTYSWDDPDWTPQSGGNSLATDFWQPGSFARFYATGDAYTVTVNADESMSGMYLNGGSAAALTINDAGSGTGTLDVTADTAQATQNGFAFLTQGFLTGGGTLNLNAPVSGPGGVEEESGGGNINLYGINTFTGGFLATSSSTFIGFNNNASFGAPTSQIGFDGTTFAIMNNTGPSTVNIPNPVQTIGNTGVNFIGNSSTFSGNWYLGGGSSAINIRNNGVAGTTVTLSGALSGTTGAVTFSGANGGSIDLTGANTYTGKTVIGSAGDTSITVILGAQNTLASSANVTMSGGALNLGGYIHTMTATLGLTANSTMDFTPAGSSISFANSSGVAWSGDLNLVNWNPALDTLQVGTSASGLTAGQLADIEFNGAGLGTAGINSVGDVVQTPEPSTIVMGLMGGLSMLWQARRRKA